MENNTFRHVDVTAPSRSTPRRRANREAFPMCRSTKRFRQQQHTGDGTLGGCDGLMHNALNVCEDYSVKYKYASTCDRRKPEGELASVDNVFSLLRLLREERCGEIMIPQSMNARGNANGHC